MGAHRWNEKFRITSYVDPLLSILFAGVVELSDVQLSSLGFRE